jgi:gliding motility-associated-like protein
MLWATGTTFSGIQYSWSVPGHALITAGNLNTSAVQLVFNDSKYGNMIVLTAGDGYAPCDVSDTEYVKIDTNLPEAHFYVKPYICPNEEVEVALISRSNKVADYVWNFDGGTIITKNSNNGGPYKIAWDQPGKHIVTVIAKSGGACPDYLAADTVQVVNPDARIDTIPATLCAGDSVEFRPKVYDAANNYTWAPDHYFVQNNSYSIWGKIDRAGFVTLTVTDPYGCTATEKVLVNAQPCCEVALPNAFTPNGDGKNDRFRPITSGHHVIHVFRVKNRWGQTMFDSGHEPLGWDGTLNGEPQDMGTYFYYLRYDCEGVSKEMKGDVTLVR